MAPHPGTPQALIHPSTWRLPDFAVRSHLARSPPTRTAGASRSPVRTGVGVLGVWSVCQPKRRYGDEVLGIVDANSEWIARGDVVVAGDFKIDAHGVGNGSGRARLFGDLVARFADLGLVSAYHCSSGGR